MTPNHINSPHIPSIEETLFFRTLEERWMKTLPSFTFENIMEVFPDCAGVVRMTLHAQKREKELLEQRIKEKLQRIKECNADELAKFIVIEWLKLNEVSMLVEAKGNIRRLKSLLNAYTSRALGRKSTKTKGVSENDVNEARHSSIIELARSELKLKKSGRTFKTLCPFHREKTASCHFYPSTNSFYCFGCHAGGDVIEYVQLMRNVGFIQAIQFINS